MKMLLFKNYRIVFVFIFTVWTGLSLQPAGARAADVNLTLSQKSVDDIVSIDIANDSSTAVDVKSLTIELDGRVYDFLKPTSILPSQKQRANFKVQMPRLRGSYPLIVTAKYVNDGKILSLRHVGLFYYQEQTALPASCSLEDSFLAQDGKIRIKTSSPAEWKLILPDEVEIVDEETDSDSKIFFVKSLVRGFRVNYPVFAIRQETKGEKHYCEFCSGMLYIDNRSAGKANKGRIINAALLPLLLFFAALSYVILFRNKQNSRFSEAVGKYSSRMLLITASYLVLNNVSEWIESSTHLIQFEMYRNFCRAAIGNFQGRNYEYFFRYFFDLYCAVNFVLLLPFLYYFDAVNRLEQDKYASFTKTLLSIKDVVSGKKIYWGKNSKLGFLTYCVKFFYIPLLVSWVINNTLHQINLNNSFKWDIYTINAYLVALFIYIDTIVFCVGYLIEFRALKNIIKTVEPTVLGWVVCLWCYPPFNLFSFRIFDSPIINLSHGYPESVHLLMTCLITLLWAIFAWASLTLGFKASNLTNRGIVKSGPYRFMRHPAYAAKLLIWFIQGIFLSQFTLGILLGFTLIYGARAWTEERHLSLDPDYVQYKKEVPSAFLPNLGLLFGRGRQYQYQ